MIYEIIILVLAIPTGFLISWMARDELLAGRKWFVVLMILSLVCSWVFLENVVVGLTCAFVFIVTGISYWKSFDKKWTKKKI